MRKFILLGGLLIAVIIFAQMMKGVKIGGNSFITGTITGASGKK